MKKLKALPVALMLALSIGLTAGCNTGSDNKDCKHNYVGGYCTICGDKEPNGGGEITGGNEEFTYYKETKLKADKTVYVINSEEGLSTDDLNTASAIQGLFARKEVTFYIDGKKMTSGVNADMYYLNDAKENYGVKVQNITLAEAVTMYKNSWNDMVSQNYWGSKIDLATGFKVTDRNSAYTETTGAGYSTPGYILYNPNTVSVNVASTLAGITGFIPVANGNEQKYKDLGLVEKMKVTANAYNYEWCFNSCMTELSTDGLVHQDYALNGKTNQYVRDYGVMNKYLYVYYDTATGVTNTVQNKIHSFLDKNVPIFGYTFSEDHDVALFSKYGQFIVPTDYTMNLTFHVADAFRKKNGFTQPNSDKDVKAEQGKHYVAFVVSDGDNAQYWQNTSIFSTSYMGATGRDGANGFPVTWSITPSLSDMMPLVMDAAYNGTYATANDYFCAPVSGQGYINVGEFYTTGNMPTFLNNLNVYLGRSGLGVTTLLGADNANGLNAIKQYAQVENLTGGLVLWGNKYYGGNPGAVYWSNGKPFIVPRESLWSTQPAYIAGRINKYAKSAKGADISKVDAYTVINVHPWSHNYNDMKTIAGMLDNNVEIVSVDRLVKMMTDNVTDKHSNWTQPVMHGENTPLAPVDVPVNPYSNDFLLWAEDWEGGQWSSSDISAPEAYASFQTNLIISSSATKKAFNLPNEDDVWVTFYARANTNNPNKTATFKLEMTVDGVKKTIIETAEIKGVTGSGSNITIVGDGWQTFTFPLSQYFENYKGKEATVKIEVSGDTSIKIDQFTVSAKPFTADTSVNNNFYSNEFENGSTEDWMLGHDFATSEYHSWSAISHQSGKPEGKLDVDASDGGGSEKRNANVNMWFAKNITLQEGNNHQLSFNVSGDADGANRSAKSKLSMYVDGKLIVIYDWQDSYKIGVKTYNLEQLEGLTGVSLGGKNVTFVFEVRDGCEFDGAGQDFYLDYFRLS